MIYPFLQNNKTKLADSRIERGALFSIIGHHNTELVYKLDPNDFSDNIHAGVFQIIKNSTKDKDINLMKVNEEIENSKLPSNIKNYGWMDYVSNGDYMGAWEQIFANLRLLRIRREAKEFKSTAKDIDIPQEFINKANELASFLDIDDDIENLIGEINKQEKLFKTGYDKIDNLIGGGIAEGGLLVIASETSVGKTTFAINIMSRMLKQNYNVHYFSLEMPKYAIGTKLIQVRHNVNKQEAKQGSDVLKEYAGKLTITDNLVDYKQILGAMVGNQLADVFIIDHLHIMSGDEKDGRTAKYERITGGLKQFAQSSGKVVILLSQLNRESARTGKPPDLYDLRQSGSIEQDANSVLMLFDPCRREQTEKERFAQTAKVENIAKQLDGEYKPGDRILYVRKARDGERGELILGFNSTSTIFYEK